MATLICARAASYLMTPCSGVNAQVPGSSGGNSRLGRCPWFLSILEKKALQKAEFTLDTSS